MKKIIITLLLISLSLFNYSQNKENKYYEIDSLINAEKVYPNFKAKVLLKNEFSEFKNEAEYWNRLAIANFYSNVYSSAKKCLKKGLKIDPKYYDLYLTKSLFYWNDYKVLEARNLLDSILEFKKKGEYYYYKGVFNYYLAEKEKALSDYENAIKYNYKNQKVYFNKSLIHYVFSDFKKAIKSFSKSLEVNKNSYFALGGLANIYLKQKRGKKAQEYAQKATLINPKYAFGYYVLGKTKVILKNGNYCNDFIKAKELGQKDMVEILNEFCNPK